MLADQTDAPGERVGPRAGDAGVDEGVEHLSLRLPQPRHHRRGHVGEQRGLVGDAVQPDTPRHLPLEPVLGLVGDGHPLAAGVLAERARPSDPRLVALCVGRIVGGLHVGDRQDHRDLLAVDAHLGRPHLPLLRQAAGEPAAYPFQVFVRHHDYKITSLQIGLKAPARASRRRPGQLEPWCRPGRSAPARPPTRPPGARPGARRPARGRAAAAGRRVPRPTPAP